MKSKAITIVAAAVLVCAACAFVQQDAQLDQWKKVLSKKLRSVVRLPDGSQEDRQVAFDEGFTMTYTETVTTTDGKKTVTVYSIPLDKLDSGPMPLSPYNDETNRVGLAIKSATPGEAIIRRVTDGGEPEMLAEATIVTKPFKGAEKVVRVLRNAVVHCAKQAAVS